MTLKSTYLSVLILYKLVRIYGIVATMAAVRTAFIEPRVVDREDSKYELFHQ